MKPEPVVPRSELVAEMASGLRARLWLLTLALTLVYLAVIGVSFIPRVVATLPEIIIHLLREIAGGLLLVAIGTAVLQLVLPSQHFENKLADFLKTDLREDIEKQARMLLAASSSLDVMNRAGLLRVYAGRAQATEDLTRDLSQAAGSEVRIVGISLKDLTRPEGAMSAAWDSVKQALERGGVSHVRILLCDPSSLGAQLMQVGASRWNAGAADLTADILATARLLLSFQRDSASRGESAFEFRFYRTTPQSFMCQTQSVTYTQPYYFEDETVGERSPVLKMASASEIHQRLTRHFDLLWSHASVTPDEVLEGRAVGIDSGLYQCFIANIFPDPMKADGRIRWTIRHAGKRLWLKGASLRSYLDSSRSLHRLILSLLQDKEFKVRLLVLDPASQQAYFRSYREFQLKGRVMGLSLEEYLQSAHDHQTSKLVDDTNRAIRGARDLAEQADGSVELRLYSTALSSFVLMTDTTALVEQYHYGRCVDDKPPHERLVLGKDMPLIEYSKDPPLYHVDSGLESPFCLLESDFDFVWAHAKPVALT